MQDKGHRARHPKCLLSPPRVTAARNRGKAAPAFPHVARRAPMRAMNGGEINPAGSDLGLYWTSHHTGDAGNDNDRPFKIDAETFTARAVAMK